jgi:phosphate butyryltransferase
METIRSFNDLVAHLAARTERRQVAVACPNDASTQGAVCKALDEGIIDALLVGCTEEAKQVFAKYKNVEYIDADNADDAARKAVALVREGRANVLQKGLLNTDDLLHAVLNKETGILPKGRVLTHLTCAEIPGHDRFLFFTDAAVIPHPTAEQREEQLKYVLETCRSMGIAEPRVGLVNCTEKVNAKFFPFTLEYVDLKAKVSNGDFGPCIVDGPLDLKTCLSAEALHKKGIESPLEGKADAVIFPDIQAGNVFYKTITLFCGAACAGILRGPLCPVVLPSRGDSVTSKFYSLALASI